MGSDIFTGVLREMLWKFLEKNFKASLYEKKIIEKFHRWVLIKKKLDKHLNGGFHEKKIKENF